MVALRKDVKVGLIVGGVTLAVVAVYVGLSALSGGQSTTPPPVALNTTPGTGSPDVGTTIARTETKTTGASKEVATANPSTPIVAQPSKQTANSDDVWSNAFTNGNVQPSVTVTPSLNTSREPAAKPSEVIQALTNPKAPPTQSASANDPSGSIASNTAIPTLTRTPASTQPTPTAAGTTHVVKAGETFSSIAAEQYGDANLYKLIVAANPGVDPARMKTGVTLTLPAHVKTAKAAADAPATPTKVDPARQYVVKPGDSLEGIASALYGDRGKWESIYAANKSAIGDSPAKLKVGTVLALPAAPTAKK